MLDASEALARLREGNRRFAEDVRHGVLRSDALRRSELLSGQAPFAVVIGCSDSRVPTEIIFDQGLGDLFVIRVAGNIVAPSQVQSVEFAAAAFETRLVVVMGHTQCGAVIATLNAMDAPGTDAPLPSITDRIRPALERLPDELRQGESDARLRAAVRANARAAADHLRTDSQLLRGLIRDEGLLVVGAEYALETGRVDFFDVPATTGRGAD